MFIMNIRAIDEIQKEREIQKKTVVFTHTPQPVDFACGNYCCFVV